VRETNVELIGHLNLGMALHPVILKDGRIMFSSLESQGLRSHHMWGIWAIHPDGTNWSPLVSAFDTSNGTTDSFHFQTQLSDGSLVVQSYYNLNNFGFGMYFKLPSPPTPLPKGERGDKEPEGHPPFGPGHPGDPTSLRYQGKPVADTPANRKRIEIAYTGGIMPPPEAVTSGKVKPLTDEDKRTLVRWIDLGCPIDLDYDAKNPQTTGYGWQLDDQRPPLTLTYPRAGANAELTRILIGMHDYGTGIDPATFSVTADFAIDGATPGTNLAARFKEKSLGVRELLLRLRSARLPVVQLGACLTPGPHPQPGATISLPLVAVTVGQNQIVQETLTKIVA